MSDSHETCIFQLSHNKRSFNRVQAILEGKTPFKHNPWLFKTVPIVLMQQGKLTRISEFTSSITACVHCISGCAVHWGISSVNWITL